MPPVLVSSPTVGVELELDRLRHREARLVRALSVLDRRAAELRDGGGDVPRPLIQAQAGFESDLGATRARAALLAHG